MWCHVFIVAVQVCSFLRSIDEGADEYNAAWDAWCDRENLPVSCDSYSLLCVSPGTASAEVQQQHQASLAMMQVRTTIEAKLMSPEFLVEIDIVAAVQ